MIELICGIIIGIVMGLTGAGGALIAIPLFMQFLDQSLKEASLYSLVAVVVASFLNFLGEKSHTKYRTGLVIVFSSALGSFITAPFKNMLSSFSIAVLLSLVSLYALSTIWLPKKTGKDSFDLPRENFLISVFVGLILGALTTFTGLGGGVLMLPVLLGLYRFNRAQALATSLFAVGLSSLSTFIIQINQGAKFHLDQGFIFLVLGILCAVLVLKKKYKSVERKCSPEIATNCLHHCRDTGPDKDLPVRFTDITTSQVL